MTRQATMIQTRYLLPEEFHSAILRQLSPLVTVDSVARAIGECSAHQHPELGAGRYRAPFSLALFLYRTRPVESRELVLGAVGGPTDPKFWQRLATASRQALDQADWWLLGVLAFQADQAVAQWRERTLDQAAIDRLVPTDRPAMSDRQRAARVVRAFQTALDLNQGRLDVRCYVEAASGYFASLSESFVVPQELQSLPSGAEQPALDLADTDQLPPVWPLLRMFWQRSRWAWTSVPSGLIATLVGRSPQVARHVEALKAFGEAQPPTWAPPVLRQANPFSDLGVDEPIEVPPQEIAPVQVPPTVTLPVAIAVPVARAVASVVSDPPQRLAKHPRYISQAARLTGLIVFLIFVAGWLAYTAVAVSANGFGAHALLVLGSFCLLPITGAAVWLQWKLDAKGGG